MILKLVWSVVGETLGCFRRLKEELISIIPYIRPQFLSFHWYLQFPTCFFHPSTHYLIVFPSFLPSITSYLGSSCSLQRCCPSSTLPDRARSSISSFGCAAGRQPSGYRAPGGWTRAGSHWTTSWETEIDTLLGQMETHLFFFHHEVQELNLVSVRMKNDADISNIYCLLLQNISMSNRHYKGKLRAQSKSNRF